MVGGIGTVAFGAEDWVGMLVPGIMFAGFVAAVGEASFLLNSAVLLRYQINAPPPMTVTKVKKTSRMPRQDFMGVSRARTRS